MQRLKSVRGTPSSPQLAAQKSFASHSSLTDTDDEEEHQHMTQRSHSISNAAVGIAAVALPVCEDMLTYVSHVVFCQIVACSSMCMNVLCMVMTQQLCIGHHFCQWKIEGLLLSLFLVCGQYDAWQSAQRYSPTCFTQHPKQAFARLHN